MLTAVKEIVEVLPGGIIKLHTGNLPIHTRVTVSAIIETDTEPVRKLTEILGTGRGLFSSTDKVDHFIRNERDNWEKEK